MRSSKSWHILIKCVAFALILALACAALDAFFASDPTTAWNKLSRCLKSSRQNAMILGNSIVIRMVPEYMDEKSGVKSYQIGSPSQSLRASYAILHEAVARGKAPDTVLLYVHMRRLGGDACNAVDYRTLRDIPWSRSKLELVLDCFSMEEMPSLLLPWVDLRGTLPEKLLTLLPGAGAEAVTTDMIEADAEFLAGYKGKGFQSVDTASQDPHGVVVGQADTFHADQVAPEALDMLGKIARLCSRNGIDLVLFTLPILPGNLIATGGEGYHGFHTYMEDVAADLGVPFWDLTYVRPEQAEIDSAMFRDSRHGNAAFALRMSDVLGRMLGDYARGKLQLDEYLFSDYDTYLALHPGVQGLMPGDLQLTAGGTATVHVASALGAGTQLELRVSIDSGSGFTLLRDWSGDPTVALPSDLPSGNVRLKFEGRSRGAKPVEQTIVKTYLLP